MRAARFILRRGEYSMRSTVALSTASGRLSSGRTPITSPGRITGCVSRCSTACRSRLRWSTYSERSRAIWASRFPLRADWGVLLINAILTVRAHQAGSHRGRGWERFTDAVIRELNERKEHLVFMLWGAYAQKKGAFIDRSRHCVLTAPHPSPLSADRGFFGCRHFSRANAYLRDHGIAEIDW